MGDSNHLDELRRGVQRARRHLLSRQEADGGFYGVADVGPGQTAFPLLAMHYAGLDLSRDVLDSMVARFRSQQRFDGSFEPYPHADRGDLCATAAVWAALRSACGLPAHDV